MLGREGDRRAPLSGAGLGGQVLDALFVVVVGLRHGGVGFVRTRGRHAFVLEKDLRGRSEGLFQPRRAHERRRAPYPVNLLHLLGNVDVTLGRHLLVDQFLGEDRRHLLLRDGLFRSGVQRRERFVGHVGHDVVPLRGHLFFGEAEFFRFHNGYRFLNLKCTKEKARCLLFVNNGLVYFSGFNYTRAVPHSLFTRVNERHHHACMLKLRIIFQLCFCKYMRSVRKMQIFYELFSTPIYVRIFYRTLRKNLYFCMIIRKFKT